MHDGYWLGRGLLTTYLHVVLDIHLAAIVLVRVVHIVHRCDQLRGPVSSQSSDVVGVQGGM
jgi:hypothetical protein